MNTENNGSAPDTAADVPEFVLFQFLPKDLLDHPPLASSLQTIETCFVEVGLRRYPSALISCVTAIESAIKAKLQVPPDRRCGLAELLDEARSVSHALRTFSPERLACLRDARNRIVHYGFSPKDDEVCAGMLVGTGLPFLHHCYKEFFGFTLDLRESALEQGGRKLAVRGIPHIKVAEQLRFASDIYLKVKDFPGIGFTCCFTGLIHYVCWLIKQSYQTDIEDDILQKADEGMEFHEAREKRKGKLEKVFSYVTWEFDCPICEERKSIVAELDEDGLGSGFVIPRGCVCLACDFVVPRGTRFVSEVLFADQINVARAQILKDYGIASAPNK